MRSRSMPASASASPTASRIRSSADDSYSSPKREHPTPITATFERSDSAMGRGGTKARAADATTAPERGRVSNVGIAVASRAVLSSATGGLRHDRSVDWTNDRAVAGVPVSHAARRGDAHAARDPPPAQRSGRRRVGPRADRAGAQGPDGEQRPELAVRGRARPGREGAPGAAQSHGLEPLRRHRSPALPERRAHGEDPEGGSVAGRPLRGDPGARRRVPAGLVSALPPHRPREQLRVDLPVGAEPAARRAIGRARRGPHHPPLVEYVPRSPGARVALERAAERGHPARVAQGSLWTDDAAPRRRGGPRRSLGQPALSSPLAGARRREAPSSGDGGPGVSEARSPRSGRALDGPPVPTYLSGWTRP